MALSAAVFRKLFSGCRQFISKRTDDAFFALIEDLKSYGSRDGKARK
jgi:hypothetical protein